MIRDVVKKILLILVLSLSVPGLSQAQLSPDMREIFREMIPQFSGDLQEKLRSALDNDEDFVELTPEQFERFRDHPANPFEGWNGIDPSSVTGLIRLQFEAQPIRSRRAGLWERQYSGFLATFRPLIERVTQSTVRITDGKRQLALGTVVSNEGHIITKLSEIKEKSRLVCKMHDERKYAAKLLVKDDRNDIALIKIDAGKTVPVAFAPVDTAPGMFILASDGSPVAMAMGVCSNPPRSTIGKNQPYLGVKPINDPAGVKLVEVTRGSSADDAGLVVGDVITKVNSTAMNTVEDLVNTIRQNEPGDKVIVEYLRDGQRGEVTATLAGRNVSGPTADQFQMMNSFGAIQSKRRSEFPLVFQHDMPLLPEQCGGPLVDLQGQVVGINIARGGRVASYAIPSGHLRTLVAEMLRPQVASKDSSESDRQ